MVLVLAAVVLLVLLATVVLLVVLAAVLSVVLLAAVVLVVVLLGGESHQCDIYPFFLAKAQKLLPNIIVNNLSEYTNTYISYQ